jgi:hypothetical protein
MPVFCADDFLPLAGAAPIGNGRSPGHREGALILNRELDLQILAPVIALEVHRRTEILFRVPLQALFGFFVREHAIAFHGGQLLGKRCATQVEHRKRPIGFGPYGVDHQRVAVVMADRVAIPGRLCLCTMRLIHAHVSDVRPLIVDDRDLVGLLEQLHSEILVNLRHGFGPAPIGRARERHAG